MDDAAYFQAIPKAELHLHLDGSVRPKTVLELAKKNGVPLPTEDLAKLPDFLEANDNTASLVEYITFFELPIAVLQTVPALERATYELCEDLNKDNVRYAEIRYGPWLHVQQGLSLTDVIRAVLSGWTRGRREFGLEGGIIVTALRDMPPAQNLALAQVAGRFVSEGVIGFDLANPARRCVSTRTVAGPQHHDPRRRGGRSRKCAASDLDGSPSTGPRDQGAGRF